ncbi:methylated-DNA--[protein]-cysteine S-methyltransferase [Cyclobacterium qasimii]|uniref:Methylated-DNA--protein-cysteine methyltransferase n=2 Tax=Cyclobacterium qasimii TaxID=1350429 RepID=S7VP70_9BACT|nr:methylated-DNA--[protein]-cysteine S-methyltransferase [Cyclobacterium qasimii]EPR71157.1 Methylated-DNA--protein-cysteine methyltransferase [Cyclobacterium qasimii M12-11B]GEO20681.1 methylated-DNA--protein-cysteine methyltransferase [Cyclobacterium qasimii]
MKETVVIASLLGNIRLIAEDGFLLSCSFTEDPLSEKTNNLFFLDIISQLTYYFEGNLKLFDVPVAIGGSEFQKKVWMEVNKTPFGQTASYKDIACALDKPTAVRAVGAANGKNPLLIIIPCHRIIASTGELTGYAGGLWRKLKLLQMEAIDKPGRLFNIGF